MNGFRVQINDKVFGVTAGGLTTAIKRALDYYNYAWDYPELARNKVRHERHKLFNLKKTAIPLSIKGQRDDSVIEKMNIRSMMLDKEGWFGQGKVLELTDAK